MKAIDFVRVFTGKKARERITLEVRGTWCKKDVYAGVATGKPEDTKVPLVIVQKKR